MKILIADDHLLFRTGISLLLKMQFPSASLIEASNFDKTVEACINHRDIELILLDIFMPGMHGINSVNRIANSSKGLVLLCSGTEDISLMQSAKHSKVSGFISKQADADKMTLAIETVLAGETFFPNEIDHLIPHTLTQRQSEVLSLLSLSMSNKDIARALSISISTAKLHVSDLLKNLNAQNRWDAVNKGRRKGLLKTL